MILRFLLEPWIRMKLDWHMSFGQTNRSYPLLKCLFALLLRSKKANPSDLNAVSSDLGRIKFENGLREEGRNLVDQATQFFTSYEGDQNSLFATHLTNLGLAQRTIERNDQAIESWKLALEIQRREVPLDELAVSRTLLNLGVVLRETGQPKEALALLEESIRIRGARYGRGSLEAARVRINRAETFIDLKDWRKAERSIRQALNVLVPLNCYLIHELGQAWDTSARFLESIGRLDDAMTARELSIDVFKRALGDRSIEVATQLERQAALLGRLKRRTEQVVYERKASEIRKALKELVS